MDLAELAGDRFGLEALEDLISLGIEPAPFVQRHTALVLKTDAVVRRKLGPALKLLRSEGFEPVAAATVRFSHHIVRQHWEKDRPLEAGVATWRRAVDLFIESGDSLFVLVADRRPGADSAAVRMNRFKGPSAAAQRQPHHLRTALDQDGVAPFNCVHSPSDESVFLRELGLFFNSWRRLGLYQRALSTGGGLDAEIADLIAKLYAARPAHEFSVAASIDRLAASAETALARGAISAGEAALIVGLCHESRSGQAAPAERLFTTLASSRMDFDAWDLAMVCGQSAKPAFVASSELRCTLTTH